MSEPKEENGLPDRSPMPRAVLALMDQRTASGPLVEGLWPIAHRPFDEILLSVDAVLPPGRSGRAWKTGTLGVVAESHSEHDSRTETDTKNPRALRRWPGVGVIGFRKAIRPERSISRIRSGAMSKAEGLGCAVSCSHVSTLGRSTSVSTDFGKILTALEIEFARGEHGDFRDRDDGFGAPQ